MRLFILFLASLTLFCLKTNDIELEKRIESIYRVENFNTEITLNSDTLLIDELKFIVNDFSIINKDSVLLQKSDNVPPLIHGYYKTNSGNQLVFATPLGFEGLNDFKSFEHTIEPVSSQIPLNDPEFFEDGNNYSTIIKGIFNNSRFILFSDLNFSKKYSNQEILTLDNTNNTLIIEALVDVRDMFIDTESDTLINPLYDSNLIFIQNRFRDNLEVRLKKGKSILQL